MHIPTTLEDALRAGKVIPFVGAGVSMAVLDRNTRERLFPSWMELLTRAADRLEQEQKAPHAAVVRGLLQFDRPDYLDAARRAREGLGSVWFTFLKEHLDYPRERADDASLRVAESLWGLGSPLLITTNYDRVLQWACPQRDDLVTWDIEAPAEQVDALRGSVRRPTIWHLHGQINNAAQLILTPDGYQRLYPDDHTVESRYRAALTTLRSLLTSQVFLFVGFSLDDDYVTQQVRSIEEMFQGTTGPHYVLVPESARDRVTSLHVPVEVITFPGFGAPLVECLHELGKIATHASTPIEVPGRLPAPPGELPQPPTFDPHNSVFFVPYRSKGLQVIGRETALQAVHQQLIHGHRTSIGQTAAFRGLGGLGKTQLAVEYAYGYQDEYPNGVIWLNADQNLDAQLIELAEQARWIAPASEHKDKLDVAQQRLRTYSDCLIIFDDVASLSLLKDYLPQPQANPHLLITSRTDHPGFTPIPLNPLDEDLSLRLLLQEAGDAPQADEDWDAAKEITKALDGLPLALELAGAYLRHRPVGWRRYRDLLRQNLRAALPGKFLTGSFTQHEADLYSTLKITDEILTEEPLLRGILDVLTWSGPGPMGLPLLCQLLQVHDPTELTHALGLGLALRMLQQRPATDAYAMHRLVREVRRENIPLPERQDWIARICQQVGEWFQERRSNFTDLSRFEAEIDHLLAWQEHALRYVPQHASRLTWLQGYPLYHRGRYQEAQTWVKRALDLYEQGQNTDQAFQAHLFNDLGNCYGALGDHQRALEYFEKALAIRQALLGEQHPDTASLSQQYREYLWRPRRPSTRVGVWRESAGHPADAAGGATSRHGRVLQQCRDAYGALGDHQHELECPRTLIWVKVGGTHGVLRPSAPAGDSSGR